MIVIYLGDIYEYLARLAQEYDNKAILLDESNFDNLSDGTYYTSLADIGGLCNLGKLLQQADKIVYAPPPNNKWSGGDSMKLHTEDYLKTFSFRCLVENYLPPVSNVQIISTVDQRKTENSQLWIAGCSISHGIGINDCDRYGCLLSNKLNLPVSFLTFSSSSITWAADQILRSDIRSCDIVVWGLTSDFRVPYFINNNITHVNSSTYEFEKIVSLEELSSENTLYRNLTSVFQVSNFCSKVGATLVIASLLDNSIISHLRDSDNLIVLSNLWGRESNDRFLDLGHDQSHPGAQTHQFYADEIYQKISNLLTKLSNSSKI